MPKPLSSEDWLVPGAARYPNLFSPGRLGRLTLRNRVVLAPMGTSFGSLDGRVTDRHIAYYAERARGGAGMIISEVVKVEADIDPSPVGNLLRLDSPHQVAGFFDLAQAIHDHGARACLQLTPGFGRQGDPPPNRPPVSSSDIPAFGKPGVVCHGLSREEIARLVEAFGRAAGLAAHAGWDAIEIHGHTGYLVDQFLSPLWNQRTDEYGGSLENRTRFARELIGAVRGALGPDFPLSFRFSADLKIPGARSLDEARQIARLLVEAGATALHVDAGSYEAMPWIFPPMYLGKACLVDLPAAIKEVVDVPVIGVGNIFEPDVAEKAIAGGKCDFVASGRGLLADPEWPRKTYEGRESLLRRCIMCNEYCVGNLLQGKPLGCVVNPRAGREKWHPAEPRAATRPKKVVVVGGGPAGMQAAVTAAERGHVVVLFEKDSRLGGQLLLAAAPDFKRSLLYPVEYLAAQLRETGVGLRLQTEATAELVAAEDPDAVVVATGARPLIPEIPGIRGDNVVTAWDVHRAEREGLAGRATPGVRGDQVVVAGGGLVGCETALELARQGKAVTVVELLGEVATDLNLVNRISLLGMLHEAGVRLAVNYRVTAITPEGARASDHDGQETLFKADTVVLAFGAEPVQDLADSLRDRYPQLFIVGDCAEPRKLGAAIHEGHAAGLNI